MMARRGKLESRRNISRNKVVSKKSVADLVPLEESGKRDVIVAVRRRRGHFL
jgi:hypothetical protein